ncbi:MAG: TetR/AcrR family transcriptional regulator [Alkalispirochaetaceae bacterium]
MEELTPKRKRLTREEKKEQTRRRLIEAATELFALKGYEGTAVEELSEHAGYSRGAFYSNFANKEELMKAIISEGFDTDIEHLRRMEEIEGTENLSEAYKGLAEAFYGDPMNLLWMLEFQLSAVRHPELREAYAAEHRKLREGIRHLLTNHLRREGHEEPEAYEEYADLFLVIVSGLGLLKLIYGEEIDPDAFARAFRSILKGMEKPDR